MKPTPPPRWRQGHFMFQDLLEQLDPKASLLLLAKKLPWELFKRDFAPLYANLGRPAKPTRLMVGLLLLKHLEKLSDKRVATAWAQEKNIS